MTDPAADPETRELLAQLDRMIGPGARVVREITEGAYSRATRWLVEWPDATRAFVKAGPYPDHDHGLHLEHAVCSEVGHSFHPREIAWHEGDRAGGERSVIVLEDLSDARWGVPVGEVDARALRTALERAASSFVPAQVPAIDPRGHSMRPAWRRFVGDGTALVASGLVDDAWHAAHASELAQAEARVELAGDSLVHGDLWMQNWCTARSGRGAVLVDWSSASRANALVNFAWGECGIRAGGGPGGIVFPREADEPAWAAWMCGRALEFAIEAEEQGVPRLVETTLREAAAALAWLCEACELEPPRIADRARVPTAWRP